MKDTHEFQQLAWFKKRDKLRFDEWTKGLPSYPQNWPYGCGPHSVNSMEMLVSIIKPVDLLEIGFNLGRSAAIWLNLDVTRVTSVDINGASIVKEAAETLRKRFPRAFSFLLSDSETRDRRIRDSWQVFDSVFIDGGHDYGDVASDIALARSLNIKRMVFDDYHPHWGPGVIAAVGDAKLKIHAVFGTMAYCEDVDSEKWEMPRNE